MRIVHLADLHLGVESYGRLDPTTGLSSRLLDCLTALDKVVDYALENKVDLVLFCGDAYKTREPSPTQQREFAKRISRLSAGNIPVFLLVGNHDLPNATGQATATEIFDTLAVKNVYVSSRPDIYQIPTPSGPIQIVSLPWPRRSALLSREEAKNLDFNQIKERLQQELTFAIKKMLAELNPALPTIMAAHVWVTGATVGSEKMMTIGQEPALLLGNLANPAFDYVALGHIHRHQVLNESPPVTYAGSLERLDFNDEADEKGFYLVEIESGPTTGQRQVSFDFHPVSGRRFLTIGVTLEPKDLDPTATILNAIAEQKEKVEEAIVRLDITLPAQIESRLRDGDIRDALKEVHYFTVAREVQREVRRLRLGAEHLEFVSREAVTSVVNEALYGLKIYLESKKVSPERSKVLLEYGERLIREEGDTERWGH
ncbi:MAG: exonuclease SbcCD subunit D [Dehalococcoidales bacterium]|nr:exonuclease SbcCD subunit D [Dehalococcoidales bacterium]